MKRKFLNQLIAVGATATMVASLAGCGETAQAPAPAPENNGQESGGEAGGQEGGGEEESPYEVYTDADGNPIDLGGIEVDIVNWWAADPADPVNDYEEEMWKYREWCEETYNFTVKETKTFAGEELTWGDCISQFTNYVTSGGDDNYYVFTSRWFSGATTAANSGLMYDLADLDCLDFKNNPIFTRNQVDEFYTYGDSTYCMYATSNGFSEPREGIYFNKRVLKDAGIDPESIYDMQANGTWTWDAWKEMCEKVHRDTNNDGTPDIYGFTGNYDDMSEEFVLSNGGSLIKQENGKYRVAFEDAEVQEALNFFQEMTSTYDAHLYFPKDAAWDFYKTDWLTGNCAFYVGQQWERDNVRGVDGDTRSMEDEVGFVTFPVGPSAGSNYGTYAGDNLYFIPACYDHDKAWKCAFAYMLFYADTPGYEDFIESLDGIKAANYSHFDDTRAVDETLVRIIKTSTYEPAEGVLNVDAGPDFRHHIGVNVAEGTMYDMAAQIEATTTMWDTYVEEANNK